MKKMALAVCSLLIVISLLVGCGHYKHPTAFPNSRWICENPPGELIVGKTGERNKEPNVHYEKLTMKINGKEIIFAFPLLANFDKGGG